MTNFDHKEINDVIHGRVRLAIMSYLASHDEIESEIVHMSKLEEAGYLEITKQFKGKRPQTLCKITENGRAAFLNYLEHLESLLPVRL